MIFFRKHLFVVALLLLYASLPAEEAETVHYASNIVPPCASTSKNGAQSGQQAGGSSGFSSTSSGGSTASGPSTGASNTQGSSSNGQNSGSGSSSSLAQNSGNGTSKLPKSLTNKATTPKTAPKPSCSSNASSASVSATYELLQIAQKGLAFAFTGTPTADPSVTALKVVNPKTPWRSGFAVGLGGGSNTGWEVDLAYTLLLNQNNSVQTISAPAAPYTNITFLWNNTFNRIDLTLSRPCDTGCCLPFFPFAGFLVALESQNFKSTYEQPNGAGSTEEDYWNNKQNWWTIGPYTGGEFAFFFMKSFLFTARAGLSVALSTWRVTNNLVNTPDINASPLLQNTVNVSDSYFNLSTMFDFVLGFRFQVEVTAGKPFFIQIDWRGQIWPNHLLAFNYLFTAPSTVVPQSPLLPVSDLTMQGVGASIGASF